MKLNQILSGALFVTAMATMAVACGGDEKCEADQTLAAVGGGAEQCYDKCMNGACSAGLECVSGLCVTAATANNSTNNSTNNATSNNTTPTNNATNNGTNNPVNNTTATNNNNTNSACANPINIGACEPICQTGCLGGDACVVGSAGPNAPLMAQCQPAGTGTLDQACDTTGCVAGLVCAQDPNGGAATCQEICDPVTPACSAAGAICGPLSAAMNIGVCVVPMDACDLINDMCPATERCIPTTAGLQCLSGGGIAAGAACAEDMPQLCDRGLYCADLGSGPTCRTLCDTTSMTPCVAPQTCQAVFTDLPGTGLCINPP